MDEKRLEQIWTYLGSQGQDVGTFEQFKGIIESNPNRLQKVHKYLTDQGQDVGTWQQFSNVLGITPPKAETNFFDMGSLNDTWVGDWIDDMGRSISRGAKSGQAIDETLSVMLRGSSVTPENLQDFIDASNKAQSLGSSDEMNAFTDAGGFGTWDGWKTFFANAATIVPEVVLESAAGMFGNGTTGTIIGGGLATTALSGGAGGVLAMPVAMGMASGVMETTSKFGELLQQEVSDRGLNFDQEGVRTVLEDEDAMKSIRNHALARGITIGFLDGLTGRLSGAIGAKVAGKALGRVEKLGHFAKGFGIEVAGGAGGEFAAQVVSGEPLDVTAIGLEAVGEIGSGATEVFAPYIRESFRQATGLDAPRVRNENSETITGIDPTSMEPQYSVNGESVTREEMEQVLQDNLPNVVNGKIALGIRNDPEMSDRFRQALTASSETNPNETNQPIPSEGVDTPDVQGNTNPNVPADQSNVQEDGSSSQNEPTQPNDVPNTTGEQNNQTTQLDNQNQTQNDEQQNANDGNTSEGQPIQGDGQNIPTSDTNTSQVTNNEQGKPDNVEPTSNNSSDVNDQGEVRQEDAGLRPDEPVGPESQGNPVAQNNATFTKIEEATKKVTQLIESGRSFDDAINDIKADYVNENMTETELKTAIFAQKQTLQEQRNEVLSNKTPYNSFTLNNWSKFKNWFKKNLVNELRSSGALTQEQFNIIEKKRGYIQAHINRAVILGRKISKISKNFSEVDREGVDKMFRGASPDILSNAVSDKDRAQIATMTKEARNRVDALSRELKQLGIFNQPFLQTIKDNEGNYVNRVYMRDIDAKWSKKVPKNIWDTAKNVYRKELLAALKDGRVSEKNKQNALKYITDDTAMDSYMQQILEKHQGNIFKTGGIEGSKDTSIVKKRKEIPAEIREFFGEVKGAEANILNTITKLSSFIANTRMLNDLQKVGIDENFMSETPRTEPDGTQWVQFNKSGSATLSPLENPIYVHPDVAKQLQIIREDVPWLIGRMLQFNGYVKAGKTILSPVTQVRNFLSAGFWMVANGNWNPQNFNMARAIIMSARRVEGVSEKNLFNKAASALLGGISIEDANKKWQRMVELQVADQNLVNRELNDFFKSISGESFKQVWEEKAPEWAKSLVKFPRQFYSDTDDFYRISYFLNQEKVFSEGLYNKKVGDLTDSERAHVEEEAAKVVRDTYQNYSKIYPLVNKLRKFPLAGAFVSFSAEMIRTTRNQILQSIKELNTPGFRVNGMKRLVGLSAVAFLTTEAVKMASRQNGFDDELEKDLLEYRPPWIETMLPLENLGHGHFTYTNPATINPYGYFSDIMNAGKNAGSLLSWSGAANAIMKTFEPFLGPEVSVDVVGKELISALQDDNSDTGPQKIIEGTLNILQGLQPGLSYSFGRIVAPSVDNVELKTNPDLVSQKRWNEIKSVATGWRRSDINVQKSFEINKGKQILKEKRRAKKSFNKVYYREMEKALDPDVIAPPGYVGPDYDKIDRTYAESVKTYNEFLDVARDNASRMQRLGLTKEEAYASHRKSGVKFDGVPFSIKELSYIFGETDVKPILTFTGYNDEVMSVDSSGRVTRSRRSRRR